MFFFIHNLNNTHWQLSFEMHAENQNRSIYNFQTFNGIARESTLQDI